MEHFSPPVGRTRFTLRAGLPIFLGKLGSLMGYETGEVVMAVGKKAKFGEKAKLNGQRQGFSPAKIRISLMHRPSARS